MQTRNQQDIKTYNLKLVMELLKELHQGEVSRADIVKATRMSPTSISRIVDNLIYLGLVKEGSSVNTDKVGKKGTRLMLVPQGILTAGVSIDSDTLGLCIMDFEDQVLSSINCPLENRKYTPQEILERIKTMFMEACSNIPYSMDQINSVGISCIGNVDNVKGDVYFAPQFGWEHVNIAEMASTLLHKPIYMENDTKAAITSIVHCERSYAEKDVTYLSIGMGVGSSVMFHGKMARGSDNAFGEVGHVIIHPNGRKCDCGQRGCIQTTLTRNSLIDECREIGMEIADIEELFEAYRNKEQWAVKIIDSTANDLAMLLRNLVYLYNTEYILVGGANILAFPELLDLAKQKLSALIHENLYTNLHIEQVTTLNNSMTGAAFIAQQKTMELILEQAKG